MRTPRMPVVDRTDATADLNGLVRFAERRNLVSARVPSYFNWPVPLELVLSRDQNAVRSRSIKIGNNSFERVEDLKYLGTTLTNQNSIQEEIKSSLQPGNACYHSVQNILLSTNSKIKIYRTIILPVVLYWCETWSLPLREERRLKVSENRVLSIFEPKRDVTREWRKLHNEDLNDLHSSLNIVRVITSRRMRWAGHVARMGVKRDVYRVFMGRPGVKRLEREG